MHGLELKSLSGPEAQKYISELAQLRMRVFQEYPYLYEGDYEYEKQYLQRYFSCPESFVLVVLDEGRLVGATTAIPLSKESEEFQAQYRVLDLNPEQIYYFGESALLPEYRGLGLGKEFMRLREEQAQKANRYRFCSFCGVHRDPEDPRRPKHYRPLDTFWKAQGFERMKNGFTTIAWKEIGEQHATPKAMQIWIKPITVGSALDA